MKLFLRMALMAAFAVMGAPLAHAADAAAPPPLPDRVLGDPKAPVKVDEYVSLTCPHCAQFYNNILPALEERYVKTGKVRFIFHDYVMDATGLKGAIVARCMPADQFFPFIKVLYANQDSWVLNPDPQKMLISYAKLGGLTEDKADACLKDDKLQNAVVGEEVAVQGKIEATPTFVIDDGAQTITGAQSVDLFAAAFDKLIAAKQH